ncbi:cationic peroxidase SPC4-like [Oryza glaberrima]|uniref:Peroxidase n=1 Tax=Oryza glaberrima TaxID=4538 RepID=I1NVG6_ORYGL|nr:cationic peroxidase SPC4-like [Oryza glaberrima]
MASRRSAASPAMAAAAAAVVAVCLLVCSAPAAAAAKKPSYPPVAKGLSFDHYKKSCPQAEAIVFNFLHDAIARDVGLAAALIRLHFHDCFVQGCDGSILLTKTPGGPDSEQEAVPNLTLRPAAFKAVNDIRALLDKACGRVVSCSDIVTLAARDSVKLAGGPEYKVPLGRRDGFTSATTKQVGDALPPPFSHVPELIAALAKLNLDATDLIALSGAHTVGIAHCTSFDDRLFPQVDATMDKWFAGHLKLSCPVKNTANTTVNDIRTPNVFDNKYYVDLQNRQGLFTSDQDLFVNATTRPLVAEFAVDQSAFFHQFVFSVVKMGQIQVLTGSQGQIRANCSVRNPGAAAADEELPWSAAVETVVEAAESIVL